MDGMEEALAKVKQMLADIDKTGNWPDGTLEMSRSVGVMETLLGLSRAGQAASEVPPGWLMAWAADYAQKEILNATAQARLIQAFVANLSTADGEEFKAGFNAQVQSSPGPGWVLANTGFYVYCPNCTCDEHQGEP